jgi:hypothetical protein
MVNKYAYKPSLHDIMEKYYEMFRGKNQANKKAFWTVLTTPTTRTSTRTQMGEIDFAEVGVWVRRSKLYARENPVSHLLRLNSLVFVKIRY